MRGNYQDLYERFGEIVEEARRAKGLSAKELAEMSGQQFNTVKSIEGGRPFYAHQIVWIDEHLGINSLETLKEISKQLGAMHDRKEKSSYKKQTKKEAASGGNLDDLF